MCNLDPNQVMVMQGMGDEEAMMNLAIALSLNEVSLKLIMMAITTLLHNIKLKPRIYLKLENPVQWF